MPSFDYESYKKNLTNLTDFTENFRLDYFWDSYRLNSFKKMKIIFDFIDKLKLIKK
jgi:hypothetical protein